MFTFITFLSSHWGWYRKELLRLWVILWFTSLEASTPLVWIVFAVRIICLGMNRVFCVKIMFISWINDLASHFRVYSFLDSLKCFAGFFPRKDSASQWSVPSGHVYQFLELRLILWPFLCVIAWNQVLPVSQLFICIIISISWHHSSITSFHVD